MKQEYIHAHRRWFSRPVDDIITRLETDPDQGLSLKEAAERWEAFGPNALPEKKRTSALLRFLAHFHDILIYILFFAAAITLALQHYADTIVIVAVAVINAAIGFFQENKAEQALAGIKNMLSPKALVIRQGERREIASDDLTVGDIVLLAPGDKVPADLRLIQANALKIEEAALTGEAVPADKQLAPLPAETALGDRDNMAYCGTSVSAGTGKGIVVEVGLDTEIGRISQLLATVDPLTTPLIRQMSALSKFIAIVIMAFSVLVYLFGHFFRDYEPMELLLSVIGLAIAAIPEGLPAIMSIILAIGVQNMAQRKAIVRNLPSVETLGSVSVICSDKTGTLTKNEMTVKSLMICDDLYTVTGSGYAPHGQIFRNDEPVKANETPLLREILRTLRICNDASLNEDADGVWSIQGDPTEGALLTLYGKTDLPADTTNRLTDIPFDSEYKYMATLVEAGGQRLILIKGAPDRLLDMATEEKDSDGVRPLHREVWHERLSSLASKGQRLIGAACKPVHASCTSLSHEDLHDGVCFLGLVGIVDPPRDEVIGAIKACHAAGINVKMITGDHADTAMAIGAELGIGNGTCAVTGKDLDDMSPEQMQKAVRRYDIFARTSPEHKLRLVEAIQTNGAICAMTGDGVNDAPALRRADVGVAMGIKGTEVTKESAEIVLADDNFSTIVAAVEEGRRVYDNLKKTILFILPTNGAESFLIIASILFGVMIPLTPVQILWVNMVTSVTVSLALAFEHAEPDAMLRPPRDAQTGMLTSYFIWRIIFVSVLIGGITLIMNVIMLDQGENVATVRTTTLQTIAMCQMFHLFNSRNIRASAFRVNPFSNKAVLVVCGLMIVLQLAVTYLPFMNSIFGTVPLSAKYWLLPVVLGLLVFLIVEVEKAVMRYLDSRKALA